MSGGKTVATVGIVRRIPWLAWTVTVQSHERHLVTDDVEATIRRVIAEVVEPSARGVDETGEFPAGGIGAWATAGITGLTVAAEHGGGGQDLRTAAAVVEQLSRSCGSTAMVLLMHFAAVAALEQLGGAEVRRAIGAGDHLTTLAFSEVGTRSHFWVSTGTAARDGDDVVLHGSKSWITAAGKADSYVWSSRPASGEGPMSLWLVPSSEPHLSEPVRFDGLGLRGNASSPVSANGARIPLGNLLGEDGGGLDASMMYVLPTFLVLSAAFSIGLMESAVATTVRHLSTTRLQHLDATLADQPIARSVLGRMRVETDKARALLDVTLNAIDDHSPDEMLRIFEVKLAAAEAAIEVTDLAMSVCGGAAFRKDLGLERCFRDARAARVMAPTTESLRDFVARLLCGMPLLDEPKA